jgi:predicted amidophosphoribosyltransferase
MGRPEMVKNKKVILVDDVTTTGATLNECARMLQRAGADMIFAATLAVVVD